MIESEFIALNKAKEEAKWLWNFSKDILYWPKPMPAICVHYDNQSTIERVQSSMYKINLEIYVIDIILLNIFSRMKLFSLTM
jgi:hypothetical protein